ncbi:MAG: DUF4153 domain-containing protein [Cyclobacteriaceae bacterium]|nr:DUF4153 domain-containing protein [Cyclobacteriaceae bacterium]
MKLPSLQKLLEGFIQVIKRFPLEMLVTLTGTISAMMLIERNYNEDETQLLRIILCCNLGLVLLLSTTVFEEAHNLSQNGRVVVKLVGLLLLVGIYFLLNPIDEEVNGFRFGFLAVAFHLLVSFAPFIRRGSVEGFWEYNKLLFIRILTAGLYSGVLFAGLAIAIASTDALFNLDVDEKVYGHLFVFVAGIFNTAFFLAGVPDNWKELEETQLYPKGLKIFTQFVLIPLATIYLTILLAYEIKLIAEWSLPKGIVSSLVLGYAVYGILSILLVYPIRYDEGNRWISTFSKWFYLLLIPLIVVLALAVWQRVDQYGITESRYILIVLSLWLAGITLYFLTDRQQNIKVIPMSLCVIALLAVIGPQSASSLSERSQVNRLVDYFESRGALVNEKLVPLKNAEATGEGAELVRFLVHRYGGEPFRDILSVNIDSLLAGTDTLARYSKKFQRTDAIRKYLNLNFDYNTNLAEYFSAEAIDEPVDIKGFDYILSFDTYSNNKSVAVITENTLLTIERDSFSVEFDVSPILERVVKLSQSEGMNYPNMRPQNLSVTSEDGNFRIVFNTINFRKENDEFIFHNCEGYLLAKHQ